MKPKIMRKVFSTNNSEKETRPIFPRWLRKATRGKNKRRIKKVLDRAHNQGYLSKEMVNSVQEKLCGNE